MSDLPIEPKGIYPHFLDHTDPLAALAYLEAYRSANTARIEAKGTFQEVIDEFLSSTEFAEFGDRTQSFHRRNLARPEGIEEVFGHAPIQAFEDRQIRNEILRWRDTFSEGTGHNMMVTMRRIISFAHKHGFIAKHHLLRIKRRTRPERAHVIWTQAEIDRFVAGAPAYVGRILVATVETGFRSGELQVFSRKDIQTTDRDHGRIVLCTGTGHGREYRGVPVTRRLAQLIAELPADQERIIVSANGKPFTRVGSLGQLISHWRDKLGIRKELRLHDARGTAVTRLVRAGCSLVEVAVYMGWSVRYAAAMLARHAAHDPDMTDAIQKNFLLRDWNSLGKK